MRSSSAVIIFASPKALAVFDPRCVFPPKQERHLRYKWDGQRIARYFDYYTEGWHQL